MTCSDRLLGLGRIELVMRYFAIFIRRTSSAPSSFPKEEGFLVLVRLGVGGREAFTKINRFLPRASVFRFSHFAALAERRKNGMHERLVGGEFCCVKGYAGRGWRKEVAVIGGDFFQLEARVF